MQLLLDTHLLLWAVENDGIDSWIDQIIKLRNNPNAIDNITDNAFKTIEENHDLLGFYDAFKKIVIS